MSEPFTLPPPDEGLVESVAAQLDLREPNRDAILATTIEMFDWYQRDPGRFYEGVIDVATGVGKTYIIAGAIDYYAAQGVRNFAIVTPGSTILKKTVAQFTQGPKSLLPNMSTRPKVITAENFSTSEVAASLEDDTVVKLYVFTVQALYKPKKNASAKNASRKTHDFQEGLGGKFYERLDGLDDLIIFADEHHTYYGDAFSKAIRDLTPLGLIGLTGTPHAKTTDDEIIYRFPLAAAISDEYVKTPVIVGRKDDREDVQTQLRDGAALLEAKEVALQTYCKAKGLPSVHPIMLVNCPNIEEATEIVTFLQSDQFVDGAYSDEGAVLEVHSNKGDEALAALEDVENPESPCRIIVQVGMLKEGWDVKNVYVIASLRASVSDILTEQTLGRGLRLPFGSYTEIPLINELDVLAHEQYSKLLERTGTLSESFVNQRRTVLDSFTNRFGEEETEITTEQVDVDVVEPSTGSDESGDGAPEHAAGSVSIGSTEERIAEAEQTAKKEFQTISASALTIEIPLVVTEVVAQDFLLQSVTDMAPFRQIGMSLGTEPDEYLKRTALFGTIKEKLGEKVAEVRAEQAKERIKADTSISESDVEVAKKSVIAEIMNDRAITNKKGQPGEAARIMEETLKGAGDKADSVVVHFGRYLTYEILREIKKVRSEQPMSKTIPTVTGTGHWNPVRERRTDESSNRRDEFVKGLAYTGWQKGMFDQAWFDSSPERDAANILDESDEISTWARLHRNDIPILWRGGAHTYNPDLLAVDTEGDYWLIEVKSDREMESDEVQAKKQSAKEWANHVNGSPLVTPTWNYLLISESDIKNSNDSWNLLRQATA